VRVVDDRRTMARADIEYRDERAEFVPARDAVLMLRVDEHVRRRISAPEEVEGPLEAGTRVGSVTVFVDGERVRRVALVTAADVPEAGTLRVLTSVLGVPLTVVLVIAILLGAALAITLSRRRVRLVRRGSSPSHSTPRSTRRWPCPTSGSAGATAPWSRRRWRAGRA
jgi:hypothetical protein